MIAIFTFTILSVLLIFFGIMVFEPLDNDRGKWKRKYRDKLNKEDREEWK